MNLGRSLGLRPLDKLQVANARLIREASYGRHPSNDAAQCRLPFWFFIAVNVEGKLLVMSPGGYREHVDPLDVVDVCRGEPIPVMAMPKAACLARHKLSLAERQRAPGPECYAAAYVLHASRDRWGSFSYAVAFEDEALNSEGYCSRYAPIADQDLQALIPLTRRTRMPVVSWNSKANWSADAVPARIEERARLNARRFVRASVSADLKERASLLVVDMKAM